MSAIFPRTPPPPPHVSACVRSFLKGILCTKNFSRFAQTPPPSLPGTRGLWMAPYIYPAQNIKNWTNKISFFFCFHFLPLKCHSLQWKKSKMIPRVKFSFVGNGENSVEPSLNVLPTQLLLEVISLTQKSKFQSQRHLQTNTKHSFFWYSSRYFHQKCKIFHLTRKIG